MKNERRLLSNYFDILQNKQLPQFQLCKFVEVDFDKSDDIETLWNIHNKALDKMQLNKTKPEINLLDIKIEIAKRMFSSCCFCFRNCHINREFQSGYCGVKKASIYSEFIHLGEEKQIIPSHTIFFSGCTFNCVFCQNWQISQTNKGLYITPKDMADIINKRKNQGSKNINWVGGDPTPNILYILRVIKILDIHIPQIWNSNMYCSLESMKLLHGIIDLYLSDFKFGNNKCANRLADVKKYFEIVTNNHKIATVQGDLLIRHLVIPNHKECCSKPIIDWIAQEIPNTAVNIMGQYRPEYKAYKYNDIMCRINQSDIDYLKQYAAAKNISLIH